MYPDIVTMAKSVGNGAAIAAVVMRKEIANALNSKIYMNTFGGNPISCAQAATVLKIIKRDGLVEQARVRGAQIRSGLDALKKKHPILGDIRGHGLLIGLEIVNNHKEKKQDGAAALEIMEQCRSIGLLVGRGGYFGNVIRLTPSYVITEEDADFIVQALDYAISAVQAKQ